VERFEQFSLLDAHQLARFLFNVPELNVGHDAQRRAIPIFYAARARRNPAHPARLAPEETHKAVRFPQWERSKNNGFRLPGRHVGSRRADATGTMYPAQINGDVKSWERETAETATRGNNCPIPSGSPATAELDFLSYARAQCNVLRQEIVSLYQIF
jgi:hypothetical protein